jgi:hypothetical protein
VIILGIDPSVRSAGACLFQVTDSGSCLIAVTRVTLSAAERSEEIVENERTMARKIVSWIPTHIRDPELIVSERPQIYQRTGSKSKANPNDQLPMVGVTAGVAAVLPFARVKTFTPAQWKGQLDKPKILARVKKSLRPDELALLDAAGKATDPGESVGIVLRYLGRLSFYVYPGASPG